MLYLANYQDRPGGGWTFMKNFVKGMGDLITDYDQASIYFVAAASMVERSEVEKAKQDGKKIVLRVDNALRNSRNRGTGMTRMKDFADWADLVIYQSKWARDYLYPFLKKDGPVIINGVDETIFKPTKKNGDIYIYSRFNRDETKNWEVARYWYSRKQLQNKDAMLWIVGAFSPELVEYNFDFYNNEKFHYYGTITDVNMMASLLGQAKYFVYTYFADACSNSLIEAVMSGCEIVDPHHFLDTGGAPEIMQKEDLSLTRMCREYKEVLDGLSI